MSKYVAATQIKRNGVYYQEGDPIKLTDEQARVLGASVRDASEPEPEPEPKAAPKGKGSKAKMSHLVDSEG